MHYPATNLLSIFLCVSLVKCLAEVGNAKNRLGDIFEKDHNDVPDVVGSLLSATNNLEAAVNSDSDEHGHFDSDGKRCKREQPQLAMDPCRTGRNLNENMVGTNDFCELVLSNDVFVDKSLLIRDFLKAEIYMPIIKRPRGWGKTVNMNMVKRFLELELDENGNRIAPEASINRKLFFGGEIELPHKGRKILKPLKINHPNYTVNIVDYYFGNYPVIYVNFEKAVGEDYAEIERKMKQIVNKLYREHEHLLPPEHANQTEAERNRTENFKKYLGTNLTREELECGLFYLSEMLYFRFNKYVYILVDEYNAPMNHIYLQLIGDRCGEVKHSRRFSEPLEFFTKFFRCSLSYNEYMMQSLITGVSHVPHMYWYWKGDLFPEYTMQDEDFSDHYGISGPELDDLLTKIPFTVDAIGLKSWYCGYNVLYRDTCNPWSVMHFLQNRGEFAPYWLTGSKETSLFDANLLSGWFQNNLQKIVAGDKVYSRITKPDDFHRYGRHAHFISILLFHGYITPNGSSGSMEKFRVPNEELRYFYESKFRQSVGEKLQLGSDNEFVTLLLTGQIDLFQDKLKKAINNLLADYQDKGDDRERLYNSLMLEFLKSSDCHLRTVDIDTADHHRLSRKPNLVLEPSSARYRNGSIVALRVVTRKKHLFRTMRNSVDEMDEKDYFSTAKLRTLDRVIKICIAFTGLDFSTRFKVVNPLTKRRKKRRSTATVIESSHATTTVPGSIPANVTTVTTSTTAADS